MTYISSSKILLPETCTSISKACWQTMTVLVILLNVSRGHLTLFPRSVTKPKVSSSFLWVFLVVRSLLKGLSEHDDTLELERRLAEMPPSLDEYFQKIFDNIEIVYRQEAIRAFQLATICMPLPLWIFSYISQELSDPDFAIAASIEPLNASRVKTLDDKARSNVNKWCRDLLEVELTTPNAKKMSHGCHALTPHRTSLDTRQLPSGHFETHVQFLHKTVRDFLLAREIQRYLPSNSKRQTSAHKAMCTFFLARIKAPEKDPYSFAQKIARNSREISRSLLTGQSSANWSMAVLHGKLSRNLRKPPNNLNYLSTQRNNTHGTHGHLAGPLQKTSPFAMTCAFTLVGNSIVNQTTRLWLPIFWHAR